MASFAKVLGDDPLAGSARLLLFPPAPQKAQQNVRAD